MFEVFLTNRAEKDLRLLTDSKMRDKIEEVIDRFSHTYFPKGLDIKKLKGVKNTYRVRIGDHRMLYSVDFNASRIFILSISPREKAY